MPTTILKANPVADIGHLQYEVGPDHHNNYVTGDLWTAVLTDLGTITRPDRAGGGIAIAASDGTVADNDQSWLKSTAELFLLANNKPLYSKSVIQYTEAATDDANVWVGFMDAIAADALVDNGAGPKTSGSHVGVYKVDGETEWRFHTSIGSTQTSTLSQTTAGGSAKQTIEIYAQSVTSTQINAWALVDGQQLRDTNGDQIVHQMTLGTPTEMNFGYGVKNGDTNLETLNVYFSYASQDF